MKKVLIVCAALAMLVLGSCGKKVKCSICGETKDGKTIKEGGVSVDVCNDCAKGLEMLEEALG